MTNYQKISQTQNWDYLSNFFFTTKLFVLLSVTFNLESRLAVQSITLSNRPRSVIFLREQRFSLCVCVVLTCVTLILCFCSISSFFNFYLFLLSFFLGQPEFEFKDYASWLLKTEQNKTLSSIFTTSNLNQHIFEYCLLK